MSEREVEAPSSPSAEVAAQSFLRSERDKSPDDRVFEIGDIGFALDMLRDAFQAYGDARAREQERATRLECAKKVCPTCKKGEPLVTGQHGTQHKFRVADDESESYWPCHAVELGILPAEEGRDGGQD